jgi:pyrimidine-nucleoside phosphorylase
LESIPGFRTNLTSEEILHQLGAIGLVLTGQSHVLAPADGKLYALRDVTGTVQSIPLIASSVMSKKIAAGAQAILLDVKTGLGAFMQTQAEARQLAELMVSIGELSGRKVVAMISDMNQPLGCAVGNALEVAEAIDTLHGKGPADFQEHCLEAAAHMLVLGQKAADLKSGRQMAERALLNEAGWEKFRTLVKTQGGDVSVLDAPERLPQAHYSQTVLATQAGWASQVHARIVGETSVTLGAGRARKEDSVDLAVGILVHVKVGARVAQGQPLFTIYANDPAKIAPAQADLLSAVTYSDRPVEPLPLFYGIIGA